MRRKSLTDQRNDTALVGDMPPLTNSDVSIFQLNPWPVDLTRCMLGYFLGFLSSTDFT